MSGLRWIFQECGDFTWKVSDCEELVGVTHRGLLGQSLVTVSSEYLGITEESALDLAWIYSF